jgi:two-component system, OmpR family, sensor histidine kinase VicK
LHKDKTEIIYGAKNTVPTILQLQCSAVEKVCLCSPSSGPSDLLSLDDYKNDMVDATKRGVKLSIITHISQENTRQCKELMKLAQVRHLEGIKFNFAVTESECIAFAASKEDFVVPSLLYSNAKGMVQYHNFVFDILWNKSVPASVRINELGEASSTERTEMIYGEEQIVSTIVAWQYASKDKWNLCLSAAVPPFSMSERIKKGYSDAIARGIKIRYITEITNDNLEYCKQIMQFAQVRHLEGLVGNFVVSEKEYLGEASGKEFLSHIIYSNRKEIVEQQNYIFENLWNNGTAAEKRIRRIEEGRSPLETKLIEDNTAIVAKIRSEILNSNEITVCSQPGLLQLIYDNFFELYREVLSRHKAGQHKGVRLIVTIDRNTIGIAKKIIELGVQVRHVRNLLPLSFIVTDKVGVQINLENVQGRKIIQSMLTSNEPRYLSQFASAFEQLWSEGTDAEMRINDLIEGNDNDNEIQVIQHPSKAAELYTSTVSKAQNEILLIFPTIGAFTRQKRLGILEQLRTASEQRDVKVRILMPSGSMTDSAIADDEIGAEEQDLLNVKNLDIRYIQTMSARATILIVDKRVSLVMELKDDSKDTFFEAIGLSTYSNSKGGVLSYVTMFESLWTQTDLLMKLKQANEQLKINDRMQKEFINVAAHELRTPIQPIISLSETLRSDMATGEPKELLDIIIRNAERLQRLASDILDVTRIEGRSFELNIEKFDLSRLLTYILAGYREQVKNRQDQLKITYITYEYNKIPINADKARITQVVSNLVENALRFTKSGNITVKTEIENNSAIVSVKDSGTGIDPSIMPRLFSKFATKSITGTGLGLFISKSIIEAHGGAIMGGNNTDGKGAIFRFVLPLDKAR